MRPRATVALSNSLFSHNMSQMKYDQTNVQHRLLETIELRHIVCLASDLINHDKKVVKIYLYQEAMCTCS